MSWNEAVFKPAFIAAGIWEPVQVLLAGSSASFTIYAEWKQPDVNPMTGVQSTDYEIEYEHADAPTLSEGDQAIHAGTLYRVRETTRIEGAQATGRFRCAKLTEVDGPC